jgi:hypothetical protein
MSTPQNTIAIVYDYDQTLSPSYMQDDVVFPVFGIDGPKFWTRCSELVRDGGYDNELAYMKVFLDTLGWIARRTMSCADSAHKLNFYKGLPEMFDDFKNLLTTEQREQGITVEHYISSDEGVDRRQPARALRARDFGCELLRTSRAALPSQTCHQSYSEDAVSFPHQQGAADMAQDVNDHMAASIRPIPFPNTMVTSATARPMCLHRHAQERRSRHRGLQPR